MEKHELSINNTETMSFVAGTGHQFKDTAKVGDCDNYEVFIYGNDDKLYRLFVFSFTRKQQIKIIEEIKNRMVLVGKTWII
jgi:hypothetical protein